MKSKKEHSEKLNRFTTLPILLDLLRRKKLVLRDPSTWEDKNDVKVMLEYKKRKRIPKLFAACFCIGSETIHHWKTYADGIHGCCIEFNKTKLLACFHGLEDKVRWDNVIYKTREKVEAGAVKLDDYPFVKRWPYRFEKEFRILWQGSQKGKSVDLDINLNSISRITLSQAMPNDVYTSIKELLRINTNGQPIEINRSTLFENSRWIKAFRKL
jgi:hypothetical protein